MPTFDEVLEGVVQLLQRDGRASYRGLKRRFDLDDEYIEDLKAELIDCREIARDQDNRVLIWIPPAERARQTAGSPLSTPPAENPTFGERRQLTVMFCDIVSSTELASKLDPEEYGEILSAYHARCAGAIVRCGGHIAQYLGDGIYAYFGYPKAVEDAASRAVRAAFELLQELRPAHDGSGITKPLSVRIGIHTGVVVMNDVGDRHHVERIAMGDVPNIAARVQSHAAVDSIVITAATRELLRSDFALQSLGSSELRGVPKPIALFRVIGPRQLADESARKPMLGRQRELALLHQRYAEVRQGQGKLVTIQGEPGMGKTRLLQAFRESLGPESTAFYECRCSVYHSATALHPLIDLVRGRFDLREGEPEQPSLTKLRHGFRAAGHDSSILPLMAAVLSLSAVPAEVAALAPQHQRRKLIEMFVAFFLEHAQREPIVLAIEDLQWTDPSTLEVLVALFEQLSGTRTLLVLSFRPSFELPWREPEQATHIALDRLSAPEAMLLVERVANGKRLPPRLLHELLERTDGVPMFIEESARMLLDSPRLVDRGDHYELVDESQALGVPSTIQDSLMARLDQLSSAKAVAQLAAILGRTFHYEVIAAIWSAKANLQLELTRLVDAGLLLQRGLPPEAVFSFKHALIQDVSYASTLKRVRRVTHGEVAKLLVEEFPQLCAAEPELIAHHFTAAGMADEAVKYWKLAADKALAAYANLEAIQHLQQALQLIRSSQQTPGRAGLELQLIISLGPPLLATQGYSSNELRRAYDRAHELCQTIDDAASLWSVLYMLFLYHTVRGENETANRTVKELRRAAHRADDPHVRLEMYIVNGHAFWSGRLDEARTAFEQAIEMYDPIVHAGHAARFGHDALASALAYLSWIYVVEGDAHRARECAKQAIEHAREIAHPHSLAYTLAFAAVSSQLRGDYESSRAYAVEARTLSVEHSLAHWLADADMCHGFADVMELGTNEGLTRLRAGMNAWDMLGARLWRTHQLGLLAEAQLRMQQPRMALEALVEAQTLVEKTGERYYEAELSRLEGLARLQLNPHAVGEAAACYRRALQIANEQGARLFVERAASALESLESARRGETRAAVKRPRVTDAN
jgi:predicted ATPase/class 3 adenylate cyclase